MGIQGSIVLCDGFRKLSAKRLDELSGLIHRNDRYWKEEPHGSFTFKHPEFGFYVPTGGNHRAAIGKRNLHPVYSAIIEWEDIAVWYRKLKEMHETEIVLVNEEIVNLLGKGLEAPMIGFQTKGLIDHVEEFKKMFRTHFPNTDFLKISAKGLETSSVEMGEFYRKVFRRRVSTSKESGSGTPRKGASHIALSMVPATDALKTIPSKHVLADTYNDNINRYQGYQVYRGFVRLGADDELLVALSGFPLEGDSTFDYVIGVGELSNKVWKELSQEIKSVKPEDRGSSTQMSQFTLKKKTALLTEEEKQFRIEERKRKQEEGKRKEKRKQRKLVEEAVKKAREKDKNEAIPPEKTGYVLCKGMRDEDVMASIMDEIPWKNRDDVIQHVKRQLDLVRTRAQRTMAGEVASEKERRQKLESEGKKKDAELAARKERIKYLEETLAQVNAGDGETARSHSVPGKHRESEEEKDVIYDTDEQEDEDDFVSHERRGIEESATNTKRTRSRMEGNEKRSGPKKLRFSSRGQKKD